MQDNISIVTDLHILYPDGHFIVWDSGDRLIVREIYYFNQDIPAIRELDIHLTKATFI